VHLDDPYCVALPQGKAIRLNIKSLSDLSQLVKQQPSLFKIAVAPDGIDNALRPLEIAYGFTLADTNIVQYDEKETFKAVIDGAADLNICRSTNPLIQSNNFVRLIDNKNVLTADTPSPIIRNGVLNEEPGIRDILNKLAPRLTTDESTKLQAQILNGQSVTAVAQGWLNDQRLL
jgi:glycine betaine/choline ABC-type transport system substrate-binding protein